MQDKEFWIRKLLTNGGEEATVAPSGAVAFSWQCQSGERDFRQTAYQIVVSQKAGGELVWDSGKVDSGSSASVPYGGAPLMPDSSYCWKVRIWDGCGNVSAYSSPARFDTGLSQQDWKAAYIWESEEIENSFLFFRKGFRVQEKPVMRATLYAFAHNDYQLFLNGDFLGAGPVRSNPFVFGQYNRYDVTNRLQSGRKTALAALVHWHGAWGTERENPVDQNQQRTWGDSGVNGRPAFRLELRIAYGDGTEETLQTDESWKVFSQGPYVRENPVYFGDCGGKQNRASIFYDANRELPGWTAPGFDDSRWEAAREVRGISYRLYPQQAGSQREVAEIPPEAVVPIPEGSRIVFDKCYTGWPRIAFPKARKGERIIIRYKEVGGDLESDTGAGYDTYIAKGHDDVFYAPFVRHTSFKIIEVSGYSGTLSAGDVRGVLAHSCGKGEGMFACSDSLLCDVYEMCLRSSRQNVQQGIISVDANREQSPWLADSWNIGMGLLYNGEHLLMEKIIRDYAYEQKESGMFYSCSPGAIYELQEWAYYWAMLLWEQFLFVGDKEILEEFYPRLVQFLDRYVPSGMNGYGLLNPDGWRASDYPDYEGSGYMESGGTSACINSMLYGNYCIAAQIADALGKKEEKDRYREKAEKLQKRILTHLVGEEGFLTSVESQKRHILADAWAVRFSVPDGPGLVKARERFLEHWKDCRSFLVGGYGGCTLYEALYRLGLCDIARQDFKRYQHMLAANRTNWESFGPLSPANMGNHAWTAYPAYILPRYVGGIAPAGAGWETVSIRPAFEGLDWAKTVVETIKGRVAVSWEKREGAWVLRAELPANVKGVVTVPAAEAVTEGDRVIKEKGAFLENAAAGIRSVRDTGPYTVVELGSGKYQFTFYNGGAYTAANEEKRRKNDGEN